MLILAGFLDYFLRERQMQYLRRCPPTEERKDSYLFSDPVDYYGSTVVVAKDNDEIKSVKDLSGKTVGVGSETLCSRL